MKMRNRLTAAFGLSALGLFSVIGSANAASPAPARPATTGVRISLTTSTTKICLILALNECITSHGGGNQVTVQTSNQAVFHSLNVQGVDAQLENAAGKCLREFADTTVGLATGACDSTNLHETWAVGIDGTRSTLQNLSSGDFMGTFGDSNGLPVFGGPPDTGFFTGWGGA